MPPSTNSEDDRSAEENEAASNRVVTTDRRRFLQTSALGLAASAGCLTGDSPSEGTGTSPGGSTDQDGAPREFENAKEALRWWGSQPAGGENGRPFPVTGSWNIGVFYDEPWDKDVAEAWSPAHLTDLIENGTHALPTWQDPINVATKNAGRWDGVDVKGKIENEWYPDALDYCAEHGLPIAFRGWNKAEYLPNYEERHPSRDFGYGKTGAFVVNEGRTDMSSPIGPVARWREVARIWFDNPFVKELAKRYPEPPRIVHLDNNEAGKVSPSDIDTDATRFVAKYGKDTIANMSEEEKQEIIDKGYRKRYQALHDEAKKVAPEEWGDALTFVGYNAFPWPKLGSGLYETEPPTDELEPNAEWTWADGSMPEVYYNHWQIKRGKVDYGIWSPQHEAAAQVPLAEHILEENPEYYFSRIAWEGGIPSKRNTTPNILARGVMAARPNASNRRELQMWDNDRYEGLLQFALWASRPMSFREFEGGATRDAYQSTTWQRYQDTVDRVWAAPASLKEFWKHGEIVEAPVPDGWVDADAFANWYLLPCDANPSGEALQRTSALQNGPAEQRVMAFALVRGEEPERQWMVYAHAPLGAVSETTITVPGYGDVDIPEVTRTGSFYVVSESDDSVEHVMRGGPAEITVSVDSQHADTGEEVEVTAEAPVPPEGGFDSFEWDLGDAGTRSTDSLGSQTVSFEEEGLQMLRVTGQAGNSTVVGDRPVYVGSDFGGPWHVELSDASAWEGPWKAVGRPSRWPGKLKTYRIAANAGTGGYHGGTQAPLFGGEFVDDSERGQVVELAPEDGLWLSGPTAGKTNQTIEVEFKATDADTLQVLMASGGGRAAGPKGFNLYIHDGTLYGGVLAGHTDGLDFSGAATPEETGLENSYFLSGGSVQADTWHTATLVLDGAPDGSVKDNAASLYLDGDRVDRGPGAKLPNFHEAPRFGTCNGTAAHNHSKPRSDDGLNGRLARFRYLDEARHP